MIKKLERYLQGSSKIRGLTTCYVICGIAQGLAMAALIPFLQAFLAGESAWYWGGIILIFAVIAISINMGTNFRCFFISTFDISGPLIGNVGKKTTELPLGWFDSNSSGKVSTAITHDNESISHLPSVLIPFLAINVFTPVTVVLFIFFVDWRVALAMTICLPVLVFSYLGLLRVSIPANKRTTAASQKLARRVIEFAQLQPVLRISGKTATEWAPLAEAIEEDTASVINSLQVKGHSVKVFNLAVYFSFILSLIISCWQVSLGNLAVPTFIALTVMTVRFVEPLALTIMYASELSNVEQAINTIGSIMDEPVLPEPLQESTQIALDSSIEFADVSFSYNADTPVLQNVSLHIPPNSITALVGPSGSGKSTIERLVARFWDVDSGSVQVGGIDVRELTTTQLMDQIAMVFQDVYLFNTSILENIRIGRADATDAEVKAAAIKAQLGSVVETLPGGWDAEVGEGGGLLSGGERQRVAIARAFLKDAPILLLDEITSALDGESESAISDALEELARDRTVLVIAHRLSTISMANYIAVIDQGQVVESGTHQELLAHEGVYARFWKDQLEGQRWALTE